jgi:hypothetical protein
VMIMLNPRYKKYLKFKDKSVKYESLKDISLDFVSNILSE